MIKILKGNFLWIKRELQDDEVIVWIGQFPSPYNKPIFKHLWRFLFTAVFFTLFFSVGFVIFLSILYLLFKFILKTNSIYIITNARAILLNDIQIHKFISYYPDQFGSLKWRQSSNGSGDIIFSTAFGQKKFWRTSTEEFGFMNVTNITRIVGLLKKLNESDYQYN